MSQHVALGNQLALRDLGVRVAEGLRHAPCRFADDLDAAFHDEPQILVLDILFECAATDSPRYALRVL